MDISILNFERFKWGGVRHDDPLYATFDLELFTGIEPVEPNVDDIRIFRNMIKKIDNEPPNTTSAALSGLLAREFPSNKDERDTFVAILGYCGVLVTETHPGYRERFVPWDSRELPDRHFVDMPYPACWWRRSDGINAAALNEWFGHVL